MGDVSKKEIEAVDPRKLVARFAQSLGIPIDPDSYSAEVVRTGDRIILPDGASIPDVIKALQAEYDSERQKVSVNTTVAVPPWDGAIALHKAITEELGLTYALEIPAGWFTMKPPEELEVEHELGKTMTVRWGMFTLPGMGDAVATTGTSRDDTTGEDHFTCVITTVRKYQKRARKILDRMRVLATSESIHKGKAFSIQFFDTNGDQIRIPTPKFFKFNPQRPVFREELERAIHRNIYTVLRHAHELQEQGESLKRGVLFTGGYGVGKTMLASEIAAFAVEYGWTFIYVKEPRELPLALKYAQKFQPVIVFCEDVDRVAGEQRNVEVNNLLNQLDGVDSRRAQIFTILTSNHSNRVNPAMRRPGRIDMVLQVLPPDVETIGRMVISFLGDALEEGADLSGVGTELNNMAPAFVKEACSRARLESLRRTGSLEAKISGEDLTIVAREVSAERKMFIDSEAQPIKTHDLTALATGLSSAGAAMKQVIDKAAEKTA